MNNRVDYPKQQEIAIVRKTVHKVDFETETVALPISDLVQIWTYVRWLEGRIE